MKSAAFFVSLFCCIASVRAESLVLGENHAASQIAQGYRLYQAMNGKEPKNWADIESIFGKPLNEINRSIQPTTRYAFLDRPLALPNSKGMIVILSRSPAHDQYRMRGFFGPITGGHPSSLERYAIIVSEDGDVYSTSFSEVRIQQMFSEAGIALPAPDPLGPRPYETANRFAFYVWIGGALLISAFAGKFLILPLIKIR